jgi:hypothetical protein
VLGVLAAIGLLAGVFAGAASAKNYTPKQKAQARKQLRKQVKKNPRIVMRSSFLRKARAVDFSLPVTIRIGRKTISGAGPTFALGDPGSATLDLGPSLGTRTLGLSGHLPAEIQFADSFDGGGIGNVKLVINSGGGTGMGLTSTSLPLLSNTDTSSVPRGANPIAPGTGCSDFTTGGVTDAFGNAAGVDAIDNLNNSATPGSDNSLGAGPYSPDNPSNPGDVVLRTGKLSLGVAPSGTHIAPPGNPNALTNDYVIGPSGGSANLFGNIPGKNTQIDVTASLVTNINTILREVNSGPTSAPPNPNNPPTLFDCRQAWTGFVTNYLPAIHLQGSLKIAPAITADGKLRIAKANLSNAGSTPISVAACLVPFYGYTNEVANPANPVDSSGSKPAPGAPCNTAPVGAVASFGVVPFTTLPGAGYTTTDNGSKVAVAASITAVNLPTVEILVGGNQQ